MRSIDPCLFDTFYGYKCIENDIYLSIMGGPKPRSFASLIHYTRQSIKLGGRLSLFRFAQSRTVGFRLIDFSAPIPVVARSTPFALLLRSIAKSRLSLDAGVSSSIDYTIS